MNQINVSSFVEDEINARTVEEEILHIIQKKYPTAFKVEGNHKEYDIEVPKVTTIEVKWDKESDKTGNYFIETSFNGKPSGLSATTAGWWCIVDGNSICFIKTASLKYVLKMQYCFERKLKGDDGTTVGYKIIKKDTLSAYPYPCFIPRMLSKIL